jgi:hypothetical protein
LEILGLLELNLRLDSLLLEIYGKQLIVSHQISVRLSSICDLVLQPFVVLFKNLDLVCIVNGLNGIESKLVVLLRNSMIILLKTLDSFFELLNHDQVAIDCRADFTLKLAVAIVRQTD